MTAKAKDNNWIQKWLRAAGECQKPLERYVFPVVLLLWPLWGAWSGVDVSDVGYSLANYEFLHSGMWYYAIFLANKVGALLMALPGGGGLCTMNLKTALLISAAALAAYWNLQRLMPGWMVFLGEVLAISVFWCPTVILYNVLSYVLLTFACLCLFRAESGIPRKRGWYVAAGIFLGLNVFVRFSNILQVVLILAVWAGEMWSHRRLETTLRDTGACILGYVIGGGCGFLWTVADGGVTAWFQAILDLMGIGGDYTFSEMLRTTLDAYQSALMWVLIMLACVIAGVFFYAMPILRDHRHVKHGIYLLGIAVLIRVFWGRGAFTVNYQDYWCMFNWVMMFLILSIGLDVIGICGGFGATTDERFLSALSLLLILILPFGSNNYTFPILLDLFLIAPFTLWMFRRIWQEFRWKELHYPWQAMAMALILVTLVQGILFHGNYSFRDGTDGTKRMTTIESVPNAVGMATTERNAEELEGMYTYLEENDLTERTLLTYGDAPGLSYLFNMEPGLSTAWPDLASYSEDLFLEEITELSGVALTGRTDELPVVIIRHDDDHPYSENELQTLRQQLEKARAAVAAETAALEFTAASDDTTLEADGANDLTDEALESGDETALPMGSQEKRKAAYLEEFLEEAGYRTCYENAHYMIKVAVR